MNSHVIVFVIILQFHNAHLRRWMRTECLVPVPEPDGKVTPIQAVTSEPSIEDITMTTTAASADVGANLVCQNESTIDFEAGKAYLIQSAMDQLAIDLKERVKKQKTPVIAFMSHGGENQLWTARQSQYSRSFNLLTNVGKESILKEAMTYDIHADVTLLRHLTDGLSQQWFVGKQCREFVQIKSSLNTNCLTQMGNGLPLKLQECDEEDYAQLWLLNFLKN